MIKAPRPEHEKEFQVLLRAIRGPSGFRLIFLKHNDPLYRDALTGRVESEFTSAAVLRLTFESFPTFTDFEKKLFELAEGHEVIIVMDEDGWLAPEKSVGNIVGFNYHRERFAEACKSAVLLWLTEPALYAFAIDAPDMWAWRAAVLDFAVEKPRVVVEPYREVSYVHGLPMEAKDRRIKEILEYVESRPKEDKVLAGLLNELGVLCSSVGRYHEAIERFKQALDISRENQDFQGEGNALGNMGLAYADLGEYSKALELHEKALEIYRRIGDIQGEGASLGNMGLAYADLGEYSKALELHEKALEIDRRIGDIQGEGASLGNMGLAHAGLGEYSKAIELYKEQLEITRRIGDIRGEGNALGNMGIAYKNLGEYSKAIEFYKEQLEITRRIGDIRGEGNALGNMGNAYADLGDKEKARKYFWESRDIFRRLGLQHMVELIERMMKAGGI